MTAPRLMTLPEAAKALGLAPSTLRWQIKNGKLHAAKIGPHWYVTEGEVLRYGADNRKEQSV